MTDSPHRPRVYLAGPEVFLPDAAEVGARKVALCAEHGLDGLYPLDNALDLSGLAAADQARAVAMANEDLMRSADALIANLTPFRGPSMDCGTAFEIGFMRASGRPVFGYTTATADYHARATAFRNAAPDWRDGDRPHTMIEDYGLTENLMIDIAVRASGHVPLMATPGKADIADVGAFAACLVAIAPLILRQCRRSRT